ncbi:hypothetical protein Q4485_11490 [Granulosicoccaceae sp. 1_MG-2023]|nr:hypothetical protein [Granulosicoccaceae sp. 1_MG-2023]
MGLLTLVLLRQWQQAVFADALDLLRQPVAQLPVNTPVMAVAPPAAREPELSERQLALLALAKTPVAHGPSQPAKEQPVARPHTQPVAKPPVPRAVVLLKPQPPGLDEQIRAIVATGADRPQWLQTRLMQLYRAGKVNTSLLRALAESYAGSGQWARAALMLEKLSQAGEPELRDHYNLAVASDRAGFAARAVTAYRRLLQEAQAATAPVFFDPAQIHTRLAFLQGEENARRTTDRAGTD